MDASVAVLLDRLIVEEVMFKEGEMRVCEERLDECGRLLRYLEGIRGRLLSESVGGRGDVGGGGRVEREGVEGVVRGKKGGRLTVSAFSGVTVMPSPSPPTPGMSPTDEEYVPPSKRRRRRKGEAGRRRSGSFGSDSGVGEGGKGGKGAKGGVGGGVGGVGKTENVGKVASLQWGVLPKADREERMQEAATHLVEAGVDVEKEAQNRRLRVWDPIVKRVIGGTGAPKVKDAKRFLARHPYMVTVGTAADTRSEEEIAAAPPPLRIRAMQLALSSPHSSFRIMAREKRGLTEEDEKKTVQQCLSFMQNAVANATTTSTAMSPSTSATPSHSPKPRRSARRKT